MNLHPTLEENINVVVQDVAECSLFIKCVGVSRMGASSAAGAAQTCARAQCPHRTVPSPPAGPGPCCPCSPSWAHPSVRCLKF